MQTTLSSLAPRRSGGWGAVTHRAAPSKVKRGCRTRPPPTTTSETSPSTQVRAPAARAHHTLNTGVLVTHRTMNKKSIRMQINRIIMNINWMLLVYKLSPQSIFCVVFSNIISLILYPPEDVDVEKVVCRRN